jgi:uncharacterized phage protein (TIGR01671 family)
MREILFRGKSIETGKWVYGDLTHLNNGEIAINNILVNKKTVGQYTGLKDRGGGMIFEGDIIAMLPGTKKQEVFLIKWSESWHGWGAKGKHDKIQIFTKDKVLSAVEIIGNIHDNPELLDREIGEIAE